MTASKEPRSAVLLAGGSDVSTSVSLEQHRQLEALRFARDSAVSRCNELEAELASAANRNEALLEALSKRQRMVEALLEIQRSIGQRVPAHEVLDQIAVAAADLLAAGTVGLRLLETDGLHSLLVALATPGELHRVSQRQVITSGLSNRPMLDGEFHETADYRHEPDSSADWIAVGVSHVIAAPVRRNGQPVASLFCARRSGESPFTIMDREVLIALGELATVAFNDAIAIEVIERTLQAALYDSKHDPLTGLANRVEVNSRLDDLLARDENVAVLFVDLDRFKSVNDLYGHHVGDEVLKEVARRLGDSVRIDDLVGRISGDEFVVVARAVDNDEFEELASRICNACTFIFPVGTRQVSVSASIGLARAPRGISSAGAIANADLAMYEAKASGRGSVVSYDETMRRAVLQRLALEEELRSGIGGNEFTPYLQPIVSLADRSLLGFEALMRWNHPRRGVLAASEFVVVAEAAGLLEGIDQAMMLSSFSAVSRWTADGLLHPSVSVGVNVGARAFEADRLLISVVDCLERSGLHPSRVWLEITETAMMNDVDASLDTMLGLKALGVSLAVDDFGTGWSSLGYLKTFPVSALKVDQSFVAGLDSDHHDHSIVEATLRLGEALGLNIIAEGVETLAQADRLQEMGCLRAQGYLFGVPRSLDDTEAWLRSAAKFGANASLSGGPMAPSR